MLKNQTNIRVLVVDDSAFNRQTITSILENEDGISVVGRAGDGDEGLKQVFTHSPDVITLDLEMPKMDGFTFLRFLMSRRPTPVIVISSYAHKENVFKALELGALDFIAKPTKTISPELRGIESELVNKIRMVRQLKMVALAKGASGKGQRSDDQRATASRGARPLRLCAIGASTGGPRALLRLFSALPANLPISIVVAQHMPAKFTTAFAERLDRVSEFEVREAAHGDQLRPGLALVAPGARIMTLGSSQGAPRVRISEPGPNDHTVPSVDKLFTSCAEVMGRDVLSVVLTGMGSDGGLGVRQVRLAGGIAIAESADTAVIFGMPEGAIKTGAVGQVLPLGDIAGAIAHWANE